MLKKRETRSRPSPNSFWKKGKERANGRQGSLPKSSDSAVVLAQPKGQSRGQNEEQRVEYEARTGRALQDLFLFKCIGPLGVLNTAKCFKCLYFTINRHYGKR